MHELPLLVNIAVALGAALVGGVLARLIGVPAIVGYLLAGVAIGPFTPGFVGDVGAIGQLAELGVVFLMFGVGLHFSLRDLWRVRDVAVPGALGQMAVATGIGYLLTRSWGWPVNASLVLGLSISVASTVVLLRALMDHGLLETRHGQVAVGWLVLEDLATVLLLLILPVFAVTGGGFDLERFGLTLLKAGAFIVIMLVFGARVLGWAFMRIAHTRSRELFLLLVLAASLGIALGSAAFFGVSLALGAFLAGVVVSESPLSHQVGADVLPFREAFAVLFFVSVGMLVDPRDLVARAGPVAALTLLIILGKGLAAIVLTTLLRQPLRTGLVVAAGLSQIGEFTFILGQAAVRLGILEGDQYSLLLSAALVSITLNPVMFSLVDPLERRLLGWPWLRRWVGGAPATPDDVVATARDHVVIVGWGRVGGHIVDVLGRVGVPRLVVEVDVARAEELRKSGVPVLFGDAANSEVLDHAGLDRARALVVTIPDEAAAGLTVAAARRLAPNLPIVARAATQQGIKHLAALGAQDVIHPEMEGGLQVVRHTLLRLGFPLREVQKYGDVVREESYDVALNTQEEHRALAQLLDAAQGVEISWTRVAEGSPFADRTLAEANLRARTGASVVAIHRDGTVLPGPTPETRLRAGDRVGLIGKAEDVEAAGVLVREGAAG
ncbi:MAG TPA: cation:proton antiporter [Vicinamibacteria bacterium]|nr:cation:proton antiporter [Vicinamibacteria bacterium]